jgi:hypothetical protein
MGSLISMLATVVLISTVSTLIFATFAYIASRRPERKKKGAAAPAGPVPSMHAGTAAHPTTLQTISLDGVTQSVPVFLVPGGDRSGQVTEAWKASQGGNPVAPKGEALFKTFKVEEDMFASLN